ncbi:uncharacterized protein A4U43_C07F31200 [Asparagus officinalis]|uniref:ribonuclease H n=1 Tax=Asparagus officinalis TaxID=4686 RepID=A0A5P1EG72_ASPOF|nr:uncharacterized protein A4U43_C07F31200 [Asparagus officinalis]
MARKSFYVVKRGRRCGIFYDWDECKSQVDRFTNASYKWYTTYEEALSEWEKHLSTRDLASISRHVQPPVCVQEQVFPGGIIFLRTRDHLGKLLFPPSKLLY